MQDRLNKEIGKNTLVKDAIKLPRRKDNEKETLEEKLAKEFDSKLKIKNKGLDIDLFPEKQEK